MSDGEGLVQDGLERASVYRLLGGALAHPGADRLAALGDTACALSASIGPPVAALLARFAEAARATDAGAVADEYGFLFERGARCPPYEGAWGDAPQLAGKAALLADLAGFYAAFGLAPGPAQPDVEDHIAAECEFMSAVALKEAYALAGDDREGAEITGAAQSTFVGEHLGRWSRAFCDGLREASPLPYYRAVADLLDRWVTIEVERLGVKPTVIAGRTGIDPLQGEDFTCPLAEAAPEAPGELP